MAFAIVILHIANSVSRPKFIASKVPFKNNLQIYSTSTFSKCFLLHGK